MGACLSAIVTGQTSIVTWQFTIVAWQFTIVTWQSGKDTWQFTMVMRQSGKDTRQFSLYGGIRRSVQRPLKRETRSFSCCSSC